MPRTHKRKTENGLMPLSTYKEAAKRILDHGELLPNVAADFRVSTVLRQFLCCWLLRLVLPTDELFRIIRVVCDVILNK